MSRLLVNTSLNVDGPIVQTPEQALDALKRAKALSGLVLVSADGEAFLAWHDVIASPKDGGRQLLSNGVAAPRGASLARGFSSTGFRN